MRAWILTLSLCLGCGAQAAAPPDLSASGQPVELTLITPANAYLDVGDYRGAPLLVFVFATFDVNSQAALHSVHELLEQRPGTQVIGIAAQIAARPLMEAWHNALSPRFPVGYEPDNLVALGHSELGPIATVPAWIALDRRGRVAARYSGYLSAESLALLMARASD